jgi:cytoskeletal protein CcmA (bactofilin family)
MASVGDIIKPDEDIEIEYEFSGSIRCRVLLIKAGGSVDGSVVADHVKVLGRFSGVADCDIFHARPPAVLRGTIFSPAIRIDGNGDERVSNGTYHSSERQSIFRTEPSKTPLSIDEFISTAIEEALADHIVGLGETDKNEPEAPAADVVVSRQEPGLLDRLAAKGLASMIPVSSKEAEAVNPVTNGAVVPVRAAPSVRTPLPSLV